MSSPATLGADDLRAVMGGYRDALRLHQTDINRLNVYPVPDGDTGTNMALTLEAVVAELEGVDVGVRPARGVQGHRPRIADGSPGQLRRHPLPAPAGHDRALAAPVNAGVEPRRPDRALAHASDLARKAVVRPVEGTILTVASAAAMGAARGTRAGGRGRECASEAADALARTPEMLPVLAQAGVVDAGGTGFLLLLDAFLLVLDGRPLPEPTGAAGTRSLEARARPRVGDGEGRAMASRRRTRSAICATRSCTSWRRPTTPSPAFKEVWAGIGDSIVVVGGDGMWNCHIHTDDIGAAMEAAMDVGQPATHPGHRSGRAGRGGALGARERGAPGAGPRSRGSGRRRRPASSPWYPATASGASSARSGVHHQVVGGQTMNPSTADLLEAVESVGPTRW